MLKILPMALLCAGLAACGGSSQSEQSDTQDGRDETRNIRNTEAIGYSGDAIADKVDGALDAHDGRREQLDEAESDY